MKYRFKKGIYIINSHALGDFFGGPLANSTKFDDALSIIGFGRIQIIVIVLSGLVLMSVINETMGIGVLLPAAQCDLQLSSTDKGILSTISFIGIIISSHFWGYLADTTGRRNVIIYSLFLSNIATVASCFVQQFWLFVTLRFLSGLFISGPAATIYAYLGEFNSTKDRASIVAWASLSAGVAAMYIAVAAWLILVQTWSFELYDGFTLRPWRLLLLAYGAPGFFAAIALLFMPESPRFYLAHGDDTKALAILRWMYAKNTGNPIELFCVTKLESESAINHTDKQAKKLSVMRSMWQQTVPLLRPPYLAHMILCCALQFGVFVASAGMGLWFPEISNRIATENGSVPLTLCEIIDLKMLRTISPAGDQFSDDRCDDTVNTKMFIDTFMLGVFYFCGYILLALTIQPIGRGRVLAVCLFTSGFSCLGLQWTTEPSIVVVLFCSYLMLAGVCVSVVNGAVVDLFPTKFRAMAVCLALLAGRIGSVAGSNIVGALLENDCTANFYIFAGIILVCATLTFLLPTEVEN